MTAPTVFGGPEITYPLPVQLLVHTKGAVNAVRARLTPDYEEIETMKTVDKRTHLRRRLALAGVSVVTDLIILAVAYDKYRKA